MASQAPIASSGAPTTASSSSSLLADPALAPFLSPNFSAKAYLNSTLPPLLPPSVLSSASVSKSRNPESLSSLSAKTTTLLSTLDLQTQRLLTTLQTLTDEILRLTPRLGYEVELLRSDVLSLSTTLSTDLRQDIEHFQPPVAENSEEPTETTGTTTTDAPPRSNKPDVLSKLEMLATVRARLEDVIRIFGDAMAWPLNDSPEEPKLESNNLNPPLENSYGVPVPPRTPSPIRALESSNKTQRKKSSANPIEEILYLLSCDDLPAASTKIKELKELAKIFEGTVEGPARIAVVEALESKVAEEEEKKMASKRQQERRQEAVLGKEEERRKADEEAEKADSHGWSGGRDGYYGLINQLSRMRGGMT
jgi:hypothetical protein